MGTINGGFRFVKPNNDTDVNAPAVASVAISKGDLCYWDSTNKVLKPMDQFSATGTAATDRATLAAAFAGAFGLGKLAADSSTGYPAFNADDLLAVQDCIYEADCASGTFEPGDKVSVVVNSGTGTGKIENQKVAKTTTSSEAIGYVIQRYASATTKVRIRLVGLWSPVMFTR
jgi:hypothetical protein